MQFIFLRKLFIYTSFHVQTSNHKVQWNKCHSFFPIINKELHVAFISTVFTKVSIQSICTLLFYMNYAQNTLSNSDMYVQCNHNLNYPTHNDNHELKKIMFYIIFYDNQYYNWFGLSCLCLQYDLLPGNTSFYF